MSFFFSQPDAAAGKDTHLDNINPTVNNGTSTVLNVGRDKVGPNTFIFRGLIEFDISSIPTNATVVSGVLTLNAETIVVSSAESSAARRVTAVWNESQATWDDRITSTAWGTAGGDFTTTDQGTFNLPTSTGPIDINLDALVQDAIDNRAGTLSLILMRTSEANPDAQVNFSSSDNATAANRPQLFIEFDTPPSGEIDLFIPSKDSIPHQKLYFTQNSNVFPPAVPDSTVYKMDPDGSLFENVSTGGDLRIIQGVDTVADQDLAYFAAEIDFITGTGSGYILKADSKLETIETIFVSGSNAFFVDVAFNSFDNKVYWCDTSTTASRIGKINSDGSSPEEIIIDAGTPFAIDVDSMGQKVYWADNDGFIRRANLDGSSSEVIVSNVAGAPEGIHVDVLNEKVYFTNEETDNSFIARTDLDGSNLEMLISGVVAVNGVRHITVDNTEGKMYWISDVGVQNGVRSANIDGSNIQVISPNPNPFGVLQLKGIDVFLHNTSVSLFIGGKPSGDLTLFIGGRDSASGNIDMFMGGKPSGAMDLFLPGVNSTTNTNIFVGDIIEDKVFTFTPKETCATGVNHPLGIAIHDELQDKFWVTSEDPTSNVPTDLTIDKKNEKLFITENSGRIIKTDFDGSTQEVVVSGLSNPQSIDIDESISTIFWTDKNIGVIQKSNLAGESIEVVLSGLAAPEGLALDKDAKRIFWSNVSGINIQSVNYDGSSIQDVVASGLSNPRRLAFDNSNNKLYWTDFDLGVVQRSNPDGTNINTVAAGLLGPVGLDILGLNLPLFIHGHEASSGNTTLYIAGKPSGDMPLFISGQPSGQIPLFIEGSIDAATPISEEMDLYIGGIPSGDIPLFISGKPSGEMDLFIQGSPSGEIPLFIKGQPSGDMPLFIGGKDNTSGNITLFIQGQPSGDIPLFIGGKPSGEMDLFISGKPSGEIPLFIQGQPSGDMSLFIAGIPSGEIDLFIKGLDNTSDEIPLFISGKPSGEMDLFIEGIPGTVSGDISLFINSSFSDGSLDLFVLGCAPKVVVVTPTDLFTISDDVINIFERGVDAIIDQLGKNVKLIFDPIIIPCPNCLFDPIGGKSSNRFKPGGPVPFSDGARCPYCRGTGKTEQERSTIVKASVSWSPQDYIDYGISVQNARAVVSTKTLLNDVIKIQRAKIAIIDCDISSILKVKCRRLKDPVPIGVKNSRYAMTFWQRI